MSTRQKNKYFIIVLIIFVTPLSCITVPKRLFKGSSSIGVNLNVKTFFGYFGENPSRLYFVKIGKRKTIYSARRLLKSNFKSGKYYYLFNLVPGKYAIVAAVTDKSTTSPGSGGKKSYSSSKTIYFFPKHMIKKSIITVRKNQIRYMGTFVIKPTKSSFFRFSHADRAQKHYCRLIAPDYVKRSVASSVGKVLSSIVFSHDETVSSVKLVSHKRTIDLEKKCLLKLQEYLNSEGWNILVKKRLNKIGH